jgi:hypothetical protein
LESVKRVVFLGATSTRSDFWHRPPSSTKRASAT